MFRETPKAFAQDPLALACAQFAIEKGFDQKVAADRKSSFYMPHMHSESKEIHKVAMDLFSQPGLEGGLKYEIMHKKIIDRFGRYPHRNIALGRESTEEELAFFE